MQNVVPKLRAWQLLLFLLVLALALVMGKGIASARKFKFPEIPPDPTGFSILTPASETFKFVKTGATTCGQYAMVEAIIPPGGGPLPHIHHWQDEWFYFPDGGLTLGTGSNLYPDLDQVPGVNLPKERFHQVLTQPGQLFYSSRYHVHAFTNASKEAKRVIFVWAADDLQTGISNYFREVGQPLPDPANPPPVNPKNKGLFVSQAPKYGINQSSYFYQYISSVDNKIPKVSNQAEKLRKLLAPDAIGGTRQLGRATCPSIPGKVSR